MFAKQLELDFLEEQEFELVETNQWLYPGAQKLVGFHFTNIIGQSANIMKYYRQQLIADGAEGRFRIWFAPDPCDGQLVSL